jgi:hypothetical protein
VKLNLIAASLQYGTFEIVVKNHSRLPGPVFERMNVTAQEALHSLIDEEFQIQRSGIRQRHHEAGQGSCGAAHHHVPKVSPIDLRLLAEKRLELQERFAALRTQAGNGTPQLHHAAAVAAVANHLVDARGAQARMLIESVSNELDVGIDGYSQWLGVVEAFALDRVANGVWVDAQFTGNGADFPVFDAKIAAYLRAGFRTDHEIVHLRCGMCGNGSMKRPERPQTRQRSHNGGCLSCQGCGPGGCSTASALPQSNDAGETIETEP